MARQKRLISQLSYRAASLCSLATQFQIWFLELIPCHIAGLKFLTQCSSVCTTEAKDRRELTQVPPCLASGEAMICTMMGGPYRLSWQGAAQLRVSGNPSWWWWYIINVRKTPTSPKSWKEDRDRLSMCTALEF